MRWQKKILKHPNFQAFVSWFAAKYIGFVYKTSRWSKHLKTFDRLTQKGESFIVVFWHNRLLMTAFAWNQPKQFHMLISAHNDGRIIADTVAYYGIKTIPGSTSKGGVQAVRSMLKVLQEGNVIGLTPDGPRGPRLVASEGVIQLAKLSGCPIVPLAYSVRRRCILNSWDRFVLALPFTQGVMIAGEPYYVPRQDKASLDYHRKNLEDSLCAVTDEADRQCGHQEIR